MTKKQKQEDALFAFVNGEELPEEIVHPKVCEIKFGKGKLITDEFELECNIDEIEMLPTDDDIQAMTCTRYTQPSCTDVGLFYTYDRNRYYSTTTSGDTGVFYF